MLEMWTAMVGGGEEATFVRYNEHVIVFAFGYVGCYESEDAFWDGNAIWVKEAALSTSGWEQSIQRDVNEH